MMNQPTLETPRLQLRSFNADDAAEVHRLAGDARIADTTVSIPHPYPLAAAVKWINSLQDEFHSGRRAAFAITTRTDNQLLGTVGLANISTQHHRAEVVYWVGVDFWGRGYCTEAANRLIDFAHVHYGISKIVAHCFARNHASARVLEKVGMKLEGRLHRHIRKEDSFEDLLAYGLCFSERQLPMGESALLQDSRMRHNP